MNSEQTNRLYGMSAFFVGTFGSVSLLNELRKLSRRLDALESREAKPAEPVKQPEDEEAAIGKICSDVESEYLRGHADLHHRWMLYQVARRVLAWQRDSKISDKPS